MINVWTKYRKDYNDITKRIKNCSLSFNNIFPKDKLSINSDSVYKSGHMGAEVVGAQRRLFSSRN